MTEWKKFKSYLDYIKEYYDNIKIWSDEDKIQLTYN